LAEHEAVRPFGVSRQRAVCARCVRRLALATHLSIRDDARVKRITRTIALDDLSDLVEAPPRAYLAYVVDGAPQAVRVAGRRDAGRWLVTLPPGASVPDGARVVLLIDDGEFYFELRGVRIRGTLRHAADGAMEVVPEKIITWDYGSMRMRSS
jgi:hypothetical protein